MANPATVQDVEDRFRPLSAEETTVAQALLGDAWAFLLQARPALETWIGDGSVSEDAVVAVLCAMVIRVLRNPGGFRQEVTGPWQVTRDPAASAGLLYVSDDELARITPVTRPSVGTIRLTSPWPSW